MGVVSCGSYNVATSPLLSSSSLQEDKDAVPEASSGDAGRRGRWTHSEKTEDQGVQESARHRHETSPKTKGKKERKKIDWLLVPYSSSPME
jgi:hypothetical protein